MREGKSEHFNLAQTLIYKFIKEVIGMSKKVIGIAAVIVVFIAIVVAVCTLNGKKQGEVDNTNNVDHSEVEGGIIIDSERDEDAPIIPPDIDDSVKIEIEDIVIPNEYPELDWEEPPVLTYYNE